MNIIGSKFLLFLFYHSSLRFSVTLFPRRYGTLCAWSLFLQLSCVFITNHFQLFILTVENALQCESCGRRTRSSKKLLFQSLPRCLVIHVKRFSRNGEKCSDSITFPFVGFDLSPFMSSKSSALYDCFAVCSHNGKNASSGHFTAYSNRGGHWYLFDDEKRPRPVDESLMTIDAEMQKVYLIFYVRRA